MLCGGEVTGLTAYCQIVAGDFHGEGGYLSIGVNDTEQQSCRLETHTDTGDPWDPGGASGPCPSPVSFNAGDILAPVLFYNGQWQVPFENCTASFVVRFNDAVH